MSLEAQLKAKFLEEASQLLAEAEQCFLCLESKPDDATIVNKIFRLAHNLKGGAKAVGFSELGALAHIFETLIMRVKRGELKRSPDVIGLLLRCNDFFVKAVGELRGSLDAPIDIRPMASELEGFLGVARPEAGPSLAELDKTIQEQIDQQVAKRDAAIAAQAANPAEADEPTADEVAALLALDKAKEAPAAVVAPFGSLPAAAAPPPQEFGPLREAVRAAVSSNASRDESLRVSLNRLDRLLDFVGEMVILQTMLRDQVSKLKNPVLNRTVHQIGKATKEVQDITLSLRMVPVKQTFQKMQRIVRDTGLMLNKRVRLQLEGEETEIDKTVLEQVSDPLVHLVRNAVDHGVESAEERLRAGKPEEGTLHLKAYHQGGKLVIELRDDGAGIDSRHIRARAIERGLIRPEENISESEAMNLIFRPGFSTKSEVTEVSGRGVGLDVVKSNIDALQGEVILDTQVGKGTCFKVVLPLTLAIIDGMVVSCGQERFVIPLSQVYESVNPKREDVQFNEDLSETLLLRDECMPLVRLAHTLGRTCERPAWKSIAIVVRNSERPFAILVDDIIGQQQIVIKKLGLELQRLRAFSGTAVLGDGKPALIVEANEIAAIARPMRRQDIERMEGMAA